MAQQRLKGKISDLSSNLGFLKPFPNSVTGFLNYLNLV